ncbi:hypothetical protein M514_02902 [Trichuris suis]|uniref:Uncharacterized protein n=1 Tax=Trichuris suis TaxID=68888 RepID=A0A085NB02_9BILA|nr:hypothetical protein M513_02902 [Trichuris suis]KFD66648.1 hypothetical protein M514_02902 [Trichuris suis]
MADAVINLATGVKLDTRHKVCSRANDVSPARLGDGRYESLALLRKSFSHQARFACRSMIQTGRFSLPSSNGATK